jgi:hypothetical protein
MKSVNVIHQTLKLKEKTHIIISIGTEKAFGKRQWIRDKKFGKLLIAHNFFNLGKG